MSETGSWKAVAAELQTCCQSQLGHSMYGSATCLVGLAVFHEVASESKTQPATTTTTSTTTTANIDHHNLIAITSTIDHHNRHRHNESSRPSSPTPWGRKPSPLTPEPSPKTLGPNTTTSTLSHHSCPLQVATRKVDSLIVDEYDVGTVARISRACEDALVRARFAKVYTTPSELTLRWLGMDVTLLCSSLDQELLYRAAARAKTFCSDAAVAPLLPWEENNANGLLQ